MLPTIKGDLLRLACDGHFDVIVHGCNCFHTMGAGIAKQIAALCPKAYEADLRTPYGDWTKLGTYSMAKIYGGSGSARVAGVLYVVNAYTQFNYSGGGRNTDYQAVREVFRKIARDFSGMRVGIPKIGAGLGGGDWRAIEKVIAGETLGKLAVTVVLLP